MSSGISNKTKQDYKIILELLLNPMTVKEIAEHTGIENYLVNRHFTNLKKSHCIIEVGIRVIKGCRGAYLYKTTGKPYIHSMASRANQYKNMRNEELPKPTIEGAIVYGMSNPKFTHKYKEQMALMRKEYKSPKNYANGNSMAMF